MTGRRLDRLARAAGAARRAVEARLAVAQAQAREARQGAAKLARAAQAVGPETAPFDMAASARHRAWRRAEARDLCAAAARAEAMARQISVELARAIGREKAVALLIETADKEANRRRAARASDLPVPPSAGG